MNKGIKIIVDIIMTIALLLLMSLVTTGIQLHEILGLGVFVLFIFHKYLNRAWIVSVSNAIFCKPSSRQKIKKVNHKTKIIYLLDAVILAFVTVTTLTGVFISQALFPGLFPTHAVSFWTPIHFSASYGALILISVHIGVHWKYIMQAFRKMFYLGDGNTTRAWVMRIIAIGMILLGIRFSASKQVGLTLVTPFLTSKESETLISAQTVSQIESQKYLAAQTTATDSMTLEEFLGKTICTLCGKHCSLLRPRCSRGVRKAQEATVEFQVLQSNNITETSSSQEFSQPNETTSSEVIENNTDTDIHAENGTEESSTTTSSNECSTETASSSVECTETTSEETTNSTTASVATSTSPSSSNPFEDSSLAFIPIMSMYIGGAHYVVSLTEKVKKTKKKI